MLLQDFRIPKKKNSIQYRSCADLCLSVESGMFDFSNDFKNTFAEALSRPLDADYSFLAVSGQATSLVSRPVHHHPDPSKHCPTLSDLTDSGVSSHSKTDQHETCGITISNDDSNAKLVSPDSSKICDLDEKIQRLKQDTREQLLHSKSRSPTRSTSLVGLLASLKAQRQVSLSRELSINHSSLSDDMSTATLSSVSSSLPGRTMDSSNNSAVTSRGNEGFRSLASPRSMDFILSRAGTPRKYEVPPDLDVAPTHLSTNVSNIRRSTPKIADNIEAVSFESDQTEILKLAEIYSTASDCDPTVKSGHPVNEVHSVNHADSVDVDDILEKWRSRRRKESTVLEGLNGSEDTESRDDNQSFQSLLAHVDEHDDCENFTTVTEKIVDEPSIRFRSPSTSRITCNSQRLCEVSKLSEVAHSSNPPNSRVTQYPRMITLTSKPGFVHSEPVRSVQSAVDNVPSGICSANHSNLYSDQASCCTCSFPNSHIAQYYKLPP
eukprot:956863_1